MVNGHPVSPLGCHRCGFSPVDWCQSPNHQTVVAHRALLMHQAQYDRLQLVDGALGCFGVQHAWVDHSADAHATPAHQWVCPSPLHNRRRDTHCKQTCCCFCKSSLTDILRGTMHSVQLDSDTLHYCYGPACTCTRLLCLVCTMLRGSLHSSLCRLSMLLNSCRLPHQYPPPFPRATVFPPNTRVLGL